MSKLQQKSAAFKAAMQRQDYSWQSQPKAPVAAAPAVASSSTSVAGSVKEEDAEEPRVSPKKKRPKANIVYSQPADTGTGVDRNTQLVYVISYMKGQQGPIRLEDIAAYTHTSLDTDPILLQKFTAHERIQFDPKTNLYSYKHDFQFKNKAELLTEIQRATKKGGGLSVRTLKESWKDAPQAIEELEKEGEVLVTRTAKDGHLRMVFWNEIKPTHDEGGRRVDDEFWDLWHGLKVPNEVDLLKELKTEGLQVTLAESGPVKPPGPGGKKKKKGNAPRQRPVKFTNTHIDMTAAYVPPPGVPGGGGK